MGYFKKAIKGAGWMAGLRGIVRSLSFIKIVILARILSPQDFGLFGITVLTIALLETFTEPGVSLALVQQEEEIDDFISTAWVISIIRGTIISAAMFIFSGTIAAFFDQPQAKQLIVVAAIIPFIRGFLNPAAVGFVKRLEFNKEFILRSIPISIDIIASIIFALFLRSPIAIIYGMILGSCMEVLLTFTMPKIRPAFSFAKTKAKKLMNFGKWITLSWILSYLAENFDDILVGKMLGAVNLGIYQMAYKLSAMPSVELGEVISKVIFPVYSKIAGDRDRLKKAVLRTTVVITSIALPVILLIIIFPEPIIKIILGDQWLTAAQPLRLLAIFGFTRAFSQGPSAALYAAGRPDLGAKIRLTRFIIMAILLFPLISNYQLMGAAYAVVISAILVQPVLWLSLRTLIRTPSTS